MSGIASLVLGWGKASLSSEADALAVGYGAALMGDALCSRGREQRRGWGILIIVYLNEGEMQIWC